MSKNAHGVSSAEIKYAIENRDGNMLASMYADDAVMRVIDRDNPPSRARSRARRQLACAGMMSVGGR